jgi:hypothetical protein
VATYPTWAAGQRVTAGQLLASQAKTLYKAGDTSRASTTASAADPDLTMAVEANATYIVDGLLVYGADPTADFKMGFTGPASAVFTWSCTGQDGTQTGTSSPVITDAQAIGTFAYILGGRSTGNTGKMTGRLRGTLTVAATAGTFSLVWAQQVSSATATILYTGSFMRLLRVA